MAPLGRRASVCGRAAAVVVRALTPFGPSLTAAWRPTEEGRKAPFLMLTGPAGECPTPFWPTPAPTALVDGSCQLTIELTASDFVELGLSAELLPTRGRVALGVRIARKSPSGWVTSSSKAAFPADAQFADREWETTARGELKTLLSVSEAAQVAAQATLDAQAALKPR